jgi:hypothetical protein
MIRDITAKIKIKKLQRSNTFIERNKLKKAPQERYLCRKEIN